MTQINFDSLIGRGMERIYDRRYGELAILTFQTPAIFEKGKFLREIKRELKDYEIKNYLTNDETARITLISREEDLTELEIARKLTKKTFPKISKIIKKHEGLELKELFFYSTPNKVKKII